MTRILSPDWLTVHSSDETYCIGHLSSKTRKIRIINTLTSQEHTIEVCGEETLEEILNRWAFEILACLNYRFTRNLELTN